MLNKYLRRALDEGKTIDEIGKILVDEYVDEYDNIVAKCTKRTLSNGSNQKRI